MKKLKNEFSKALKFLKEVNGRTLLAHHSDLDGVVSASILVKFWKEVGYKDYRVLPAAIENVETLLKLARRFDNLVILDVDLSFMKRDFEKLGKRILIVDHHPPKEDMNSRNILYINPRLKDPEVYQPVSYLMYEILKESLEEDVSWLAALGTVSDYGFEDCMKLLRRFVRIKDKRKLWKTRMGKLAIKVNGALSILGFKRILRILSSCSNMKELEENEEVKRGFLEYMEVYERCKKAFWENAEVYEDLNLIFSTIPTRKRAISSSLATELSTKYPEKIIVIFRRVGKKCVVSVRYQEGKFHLGKLMEKCAEGLDGGGGHRNAAGATIEWNKREVLKKRIVEELRKIHRKHRK